MVSSIRLRRGTSSQWSSLNPILALGEPGSETDTGRMKIGDGVTAWTSLPYTNGNQLLDQLPSGTTLTVLKSGSTWPARPTARPDIVVAWKGPDPSPDIITSGTGGMLDNVDYRLVTS